MKKLIKSHCQDVDIAFAQNGWINATGIAEKFGKRPPKLDKLTPACRYWEPRKDSRYG